MKAANRPVIYALFILTFAFSGFAIPQIASASDGADHNLPTASPGDVGVDAEPLIYLSKWLRKDNLDIHSLLLVKNGKLIFERYTDGLDRDYNYELYSDTKGISAILAGILIDEGKLRLDEKISPMIAKLRPDLADKFANKSAIDVRDLLMMSSGLNYQFNAKNTGDPIYYDTPDRLKLAANTSPRRPPGEKFYYTDINAVLEAAVLSEAAGEPIQDFAKEKLFKPLSMKNYTWGRADEKGLVSVGWGMRLRPIDMAKIGLLVLNGGEWKGHQIVSQKWIKQMVASAGIVPQFGYDWWINTIVKNEPEYSTIGYKGQFITVLPKQNAVVVMTSLLPKKGNQKIFRGIVNDYILPALNGKRNDEPLLNAKLSKELVLSKKSHPTPGSTSDPEFTDCPRR